MIRFLRTSRALALAAAFGGCAATCPHVPTSPGTTPSSASRATFEFDRDTFAFGNETVWNYKDGAIMQDDRAAPKSGRRYSRRCFVMTRAALQFHKFARFAPEEPGLSETDLRARIRALVRKPVWSAAQTPAERIVIPGYPSLRAFSAAEPLLLQDLLGAGWTTYFRPGHVAATVGPSRAHQAGVWRALRRRLNDAPVPVWMFNFPSLSINHAVLVYGRVRPAQDGRFAVSVYDPNVPEAPVSLEWDPADQTFRFSKTFYYRGGPVAVRLVFTDPFH